MKNWIWLPTRRLELLFCCFLVSLVGYVRASFNIVYLPSDCGIFKGKQEVEWEGKQLNIYGITFVLCLTAHLSLINWGKTNGIFLLVLILRFIFVVGKRVLVTKKEGKSLKKKNWKHERPFQIVTGVKKF